MMISPENYCEEYLREKDAKQILSIIRGLKNEMSHLKNIMEHPDYGTESKVCQVNQSDYRAPVNTLNEQNRHLSKWAAPTTLRERNFAHWIL